MEREQRGSAVHGNRPSLVRLWIPPAGLALLIFLLSSTPGAYFPKHADFLNNIVHFTEFGLLGFLLSRTLNHGYKMSNTGLFLLTVLLCFSFGLLDEAHQFMVPERMFDVVDLVFDSLGGAAGSGAFILSNTLKTNRSPAHTAPTGEMDD